MTRRPLSWYSGVRTRVVLLAVIPLLAIAFVIGGYMVSVRLADARQALDERGEIIAANLAMAAELGVLTRNLDRLQGLCEAAQRQPDVAWAAVLGADGELLAESGDASDPDNARGVHRAAMSFSSLSPVAAERYALRAPHGEWCRPRRTWRRKSCLMWP